MEKKKAKEKQPSKDAAPVNTCPVKPSTQFITTNRCRKKTTTTRGESEGRFMSERTEEKRTTVLLAGQPEVTARTNTKTEEEEEEEEVVLAGPDRC